jgi:hypothetical protein
MSTKVAEGRESALRKVARRGFFGTLGAGGLTAASALFGRSTPAYAICNRECCALLVCPNVSMATCRANQDYIWSCAASPRRGCSCCEAYYSGKQHSAYSCTSCLAVPC